MSFNKDSGYGQAMLNMVSSQVPAFGNILVVFDPDDTDEANFQHWQEIMTPDNDGQVRFYTSLLAAYNACESNNNDVILLDGNSAHTLATQLTISKNRIHFIGMDGGGRLHGQGAKVQNTDGTAAVSVIHVTGTRNTFRNIKFIQSDDDATSLRVLTEAGESSLYKNCSFIFGKVDNLDQTDAYEVFMSGDSTEFHDCTFGADTLTTSAARAVVAFDTTGSSRAKSTVWKDCIFNIQSSSADANFVRVIATSDLAFGNIFINPVFLASLVSSTSAITLTDAVDSVASLAEGNVLFVNPATNCTNFSSALTQNFKVVGASGTAATTGVGITPS